MNIAYMIVPKVGGTFRFYSSLRSAMRPLGWKVFGLSAGADESRLWDDKFADDNCALIAEGESDSRAIARRIVKWTEEQEIDIFMPMSSMMGASSVPHLHSRIKVINRCNSITRHAYDIVLNNRQFVSSIVATSKRQFDDLRLKYKVHLENLELIPHGVEVEKFSGLRVAPTGDRDRIRLGFVGRLKHYDKGCLYLARVAKLLRERGVQFSLDIVGDGPDREALEQKMGELVQYGIVRFHGTLSHDQVTEVLATIDVFVFPSHFEGFGFALVEAMAAGCVPVASNIGGVTDWIVEHGRTGILCPVGAVERFADSIAMLAAERRTLRTMSIEAASEAARRFSVVQMAKGYDQLFRRVVAEPPSEIRPRPWSEFRLDTAYKPTWRRFVPPKIKEWARQMGSRL